MTASRLRLVAGLLCICLLLTGGAAAADQPPRFVPNDPGFKLGANELSLESLGIPEAWSTTQGDPAVVIAIVDSGVVREPDLVPNLVPGYNAIDGSANTIDENGHGSAMASIAGAVLNNGVGIAGICGKCRVMPVKIAGADGRHLNAVMAIGIDWAVAHGAKVINLSRNIDPGVPPDPVVNAAVSNAVGHGIPVVIGAGNNASTDPASDVLPSSNPEAIRVAAYLFYRDALDPSSNHGSWVDVAAANTLSGLGPRPDQGGTSSAAAAVSGIVGLMLSCNPALSPAQVKSILMATSTPHPIDVVARGEVNAYRAVVAAGCKPGSPTSPAMVRLAVKVKGRGTVSRKPAQATYQVGSLVVLTAKAKPHWRFAAWAGLCRGKKPVCKLKLARSGSATAVFKRT